MKYWPDINAVSDFGGERLRTTTGLLCRRGPRNQRGTGRLLPLSCSSAPIAPLACHHLGERSWLKVQVPLDRQTKWAANALQLGEHEVAPFVVHASRQIRRTGNRRLPRSLP